MFGVFHRLLASRIQNNLLELVYVPGTRLFQRYKATNANTVTASNGPTMKYHCTVALAEKKTTKKQQQQQNKQTKQKDTWSLKLK